MSRTLPLVVSLIGCLAVCGSCGSSGGTRDDGGQAGRAPGAADDGGADAGGGAGGMGGAVGACAPCAGKADTCPADYAHASSCTADGATCCGGGKVWICYQHNCPAENCTWVTYCF
jgi:hypothetical protein